MITPTQLATLNGYDRFIAEANFAHPRANLLLSRGFRSEVEQMMRNTYGTLNHLSPRQFNAEARVCFAAALAILDSTPEAIAAEFHCDLAFAVEYRKPYVDGAAACAL